MYVQPSATLPSTRWADLKFSSLWERCTARRQIAESSLQRSVHRRAQTYAKGVHARVILIDNQQLAVFMSKAHM
jgi:restriction endonuclease Mrr